MGLDPPSVDPCLGRLRGHPRPARMSLTVSLGGSGPARASRARSADGSSPPQAPTGVQIDVHQPPDLFLVEQLVRSEGQFNCPKKPKDRLPPGCQRRRPFEPQLAHPHLSEGPGELGRRRERRAVDSSRSNREIVEWSTPARTAS